MSFEMQIFSFLFLMLGSFKIIVPFVKIAMNATPELTSQIDSVFTTCSFRL
ncbi:hypothetical protein [Flavobacterium sp. ZT3R18]|uniref:hypothetical protein n=1 Tax=Flavobacterium sp. ZT3R18 TaxID=2594429 RepID=UPI00163DD847|nr:hypothetical protein [Flavobacterium sp. ZT3R18]